MRRAAALAGVLALAITAPGAVAAAGEEAAGSRPNIVIILIDTLRADHLPFHGYDRNTAPFMSRLAKESILFERAFAPASYTAPSSASVFTSLYPQHHGVVIGQRATGIIREKVDPTISLNRIPGEAMALGEVMKAAGYATFGISDNYNVSEEMGFAQGFDRFVSNPTYYWGAEEMNRELKEWSSEIRKSEPYFLYVHYFDPHSPYHKREPWYGEYEAEIEASRGRKPHREVKQEWTRARYDSEIAYLDGYIREMYVHFGWDRNTILMITSDHGEEFWEHGAVGHGRTLYDEVLHVPLFVRDTTGRFAPRRVATPVSLVDVLPTLAEMVGQPPVPLAQGVSLLDLMEGEERGEQRLLFAHLERHIFKITGVNPTTESHEHYISRAVLQGAWKLIVDTRGEANLYRRAGEGVERVSLLEEHSGRAKELAAGLHAFVRLAPALAPDMFEKTLTPEEIERLKTLGYVD